MEQSLEQHLLLYAEALRLSVLKQFIGAKACNQVVTQIKYAGIPHVRAHNTA